VTAARIEMKKARLKAAPEDLLPQI